MKRWWQQLEPEDVLVPTAQPRSALSLEDDVRAQLGPGALDWAHALAIDLTREYVDVSIPELARSADFTRGLEVSAEANTLGILLLLASESPEVQPPQEALEFADEAAMRQVPLAAVLRGYRLGVEHWLRWCAPAIARHADVADHAKELQFAVAAAVRYSDHLSEIMIVEYERELQRRATSGAARRAALVGAILTGDVVDLDDASHRLQYHLQGRHMALSLSLRSGGSKQVDALETLETEVRSFAASVRATGLLSMATGSTTMDAWVAVPDDAERPRTPGHEHVTMGVGSPASGRIGFVRSHRESQRALEILHMAESGRLDPVTYYDQVRLISLLAKDLPAAGAFVVSTLGRLAGTDERSHELRETLFAFLQANRSYTAVAHSSHLHKNTVIQRVMKASELAGRDMTKHIDVHVALMLVRVLGDRVLDSS